jgi:hypothetical protein
MNYTIAFKMPNEEAAAVELAVSVVQKASLLQTFDFAVGELRSLLIGHGIDQGFELVDGQTDSADSSPGLPSQLPVPTSSRSDTGADPSWYDRLTYAHRYGAAHAKMLRDETAEFPEYIQLGIANRQMVVLRTKDGSIPDKKVYDRKHDWAPVLGEDYLSDGSLREGGKSIFKAWPSKLEVEAYLQGAGIRYK